MLEVCCLLCLVYSTCLFFPFPFPVLASGEAFGHFVLGSLQVAEKSLVST